MLLGRKEFTIFVDCTIRILDFLFDSVDNLEFCEVLVHLEGFRTSIAIKECPSKETIDNISKWTRTNIYM